MEAFGIFEGGGAKGLAHVGALKSAVQRHVEFVGVAGASAGAIVAALVAAGYSADELYSPNNNSKGVLDTDFLDFLDKDAWLQWIKLTQNAQKNFVNRSAIGAWIYLPIFYVKNFKALRRLVRDRGFFNTDKFREHLNEMLRKKAPRCTGTNQTVTFADLDVPLKIIASDLTNQTIKIFSTDNIENKKESVALAVCASISIPYFFVPTIIDGAELVDGGLLSNFPAWLFDNERREKGPQIPTFGFRLVAPQQKDDVINSMLDFSLRIFNTALSGDQQLQTRAIENLNIVPLHVSVSTFDFDLDTNKKNQLFNEGRNCGHDFFLKEVGPQDPKVMRTLLEMARSAMRDALARSGTQKQNTHLRVNVIMPVDEERLRVLYNCGMDDDADDRLEFPVDSGAAGQCWKKHIEIVCDLEDARSTFKEQWKMNKYQQAMVRRELCSLLCVPIFDKTAYNSMKRPELNPVIGVLCFDSDEKLLLEFASFDAQDTAKKAAQIVADKLKP